MKVLTLNEQQFSDRCAELARLIAQDNYQADGAEASRRFDAIIGIAEGGVHVSRAMWEAEPSIAKENFWMKASRPSTRYKTGVIATILHALPNHINNQLRILESKILAKNKGKDNIKVTIPEQLREFIAATPRRVLLVDDSVDSGNSMKSSVEALLAVNPGTKITTAAITITTLSPIISADYFLFNNQTLIRYPWSKDSKKR